MRRKLYQPKHIFHVRLPAIFHGSFHTKSIYHGKRARPCTVSFHTGGFVTFSTLLALPLIRPMAFLSDCTNYLGVISNIPPAITLLEKCIANGRSRRQTRPYCKVYSVILTFLRYTRACVILVGYKGLNENLIKSIDTRAHINIILLIRGQGAR